MPWAWQHLRSTQRGRDLHIPPLASHLGTGRACLRVSALAGQALSTQQQERGTCEGPTGHSPPATSHVTRIKSGTWPTGRPALWDGGAVESHFQLLPTMRLKSYFIRCSNYCPPVFKLPLITCTYALPVSDTALIEGGRARRYQIPPPSLSSHRGHNGPLPSPQPFCLPSFPSPSLVNPPLLEPGEDAGTQPQLCSPHTLAHGGLPSSGSFKNHGRANGS